MDDYDELIERLGQLGRQPIDPHVQATHLERIHAIASPGRTRVRTIGVLVSVAAMASLLVAGLVIAQQRGDAPSIRPADPVEEPVAPVEDDPAAEDGDRVDGDGAGDEFSCSGPPPFAGVEPESAEARAAESERFEQFRATECPDADADADADADPDDGAGDDRPPTVAGASPCVGPPPFAGIPALDGRERAVEARELGRVRAECERAGDDGASGPSDGTGPGGGSTPEPAGPPATSGPPEGAGPPDEAGPPESPGPPEGEGPPANPGPPEGEGPPESPGPPEGEGPPSSVGPPAGEGPPSSVGPPDGAGPPAGGAGGGGGAGG